MTRGIVSLFVFAAMATACGKTEKAPAVDPAYARDVDRFCNAEEQAGAAHIETAAKSMVVADWLGRTLETPKARQFLASIASVPPTEKAALLRAEGKRVGLADCPSATAWEDEAKRLAAPD